MHEIILGYQGEMSLKGLNRNQFESAGTEPCAFSFSWLGTSFEAI